MHVCVHMHMCVHSAARLLLQCLFCVGAFYVISTVVCVHVLAFSAKFALSLRERERRSLSSALKQLSTSQK